MSGSASISLSAVLVAVFISRALVLVHTSDQNWGKKVQCFVVDETIVCPGCNYRAGLSCPRKLKNSQNCIQPITQLPPTTESTSPPKTTYKVETSYEENNLTDIPLLEYNSTPPETNEIQKEPTQIPIDMAIYLYRLLGPKTITRYRYKREVEQKEEETEPEICNWNGDCPCPLICCKTGPGCPKRCVMGVRLPPPWG